MSLKNINIIYKFIGYVVLLSIIPLLVMSAVSFTTSANIVRNQNENYTQEIVANQLEYLQLEQSQVESLIVNISGVEAIRDSVSDDNSDSSTFSQLSTEARIGYVLNSYISIESLVSIDIFATNGLYYTVGDTLVVENIRQDIREQIWQEALANNQQIFWAGVEDNINADSPHPKVITAGTIFYQFNRETVQQDPVALLLVNYSVDSLYEHFNHVDLGNGTYMIVLDNKGRFVYHPDRTKIGTYLDKDILGKIDAESGTITTRVDDSEVSISYARSGKSNWVVASLVPVSTFESTASPIRNATLITLVAVLAFVALIAYLYNQDIVAPIRELTHRLNKLEGNDVTEHSHMPERGQDEVGKLINGFNLLVDSLIANHKVEMEREALIDDLQIAMNLAKESSRLKSQFLATISHELRTPLNAIVGYAGIIVEGYGGTVDNEAMRMVQRIYNSSDHLSRLIDDLLDLSKIEAGYLELQLEAFNIRACIEEINQEMKVLANQANLTFEVNIATNIPDQLVSDEGRLKQVLTNLISNAIKFTPQGQVSLSVQQINERIEFEVKDTGVGIPSEAISYIFDEFRQIDGSYQRSHGGTGLGLAIVWRIVEALQGEVQVKSKVGEGSTFTVILPLTRINKTEKVATNENSA